MAAYCAVCSDEALDKPVDTPRMDVCAMLRVAVEDQGYPHTAAAIDTGYAPDYWTRVLSGERGIRLSALGKLPRHVQIEFLAAWRQSSACGLSGERWRGCQTSRSLLRVSACE